MIVGYPKSSDNAYAIAADVFTEYWHAITGEDAVPMPVSGDDLPNGGLVLIGNDAVNA